MEVFYLTLNQMLTMTVFILIGYILRKSKILPDTANLTLSRLETYFIVPALYLYNWMRNCTISTLKENYILIVYGLVLILCAITLSYPLSKLFIRKADTNEMDYQRCIYRYALAFGNYGFVGNYIVLGIWGSEVFFKYTMMTFCIGFACSSWGIYTLVPKASSGKQTIKTVLKRMMKPPIIAMFVGMFAGLLQLQQYVPEFLMNVLADGSECMGPIAMVLAGLVIGGYDLKELLTYKKVYVVTLMRLIVLPGIMALILKGIGVNKEILTLALIAFATPMGLNTIVYPSAFGGDVKTGASMTMISSVLSIITIPLMYLLLIA